MWPSSCSTSDPIATLTTGSTQLRPHAKNFITLIWWMQLEQSVREKNNFVSQHNKI